MRQITIPSSIPSVQSYKRGKNYVLHDPSQMSNPTYYKNVLAKAKQSIRIIDPYALCHDAEGVFENVKQSGIKIEIITIGSSHNDAKDYANKFARVIEKNRCEYNLEIFSFKPNNRVIYLWHDRYLIVDDTDYYLIGSSLDAQVKSDRYHGIYKLTEDEDKRIVKDIYQEIKAKYNSKCAYKITRKKP